MSMSATKKGRGPKKLAGGEPSLVARAVKVRAVLDAAAEVLGEDGVEGFNVREVAKRVGASTMVIYTLFGGRDGLLAAVCQDSLERLAVSFDRVGHGDHLAALGSLAVRYRRFALTRREYYRAILLAPSLSSQVRGSRALAILVRTVKACMDAGALAQGDPEIAADALWGLVHGMVGLELGGHFPSSRVAEERFLLAGKALLAGLR